MHFIKFSRHGVELVERSSLAFLTSGCRRLARLFELRKSRATQVRDESVVVRCSLGKLGLRLRFGSQPHFLLFIFNGLDQVNALLNRPHRCYPVVDLHRFHDCNQARPLGHADSVSQRPIEEFSL